MAMRFEREGRIEDLFAVQFHISHISAPPECPETRYLLCDRLKIHPQTAISLCHNWVPTGFPPCHQDAGKGDAIEVKVIRTRVAAVLLELPSGSSTSCSSTSNEVTVHWGADGSMLIPCAGGSSWLQVLEVQPPTKKAMQVKDFRNGIRKKRLLLG